MGSSLTKLLSSPCGRFRLLNQLEGRFEDERIVRLIQSGSEDGLELLFAQYGTRVKAVLIRRFGEMREHDIEQAINDAACDIWCHFDRYDPSRGTLRGWLLTASRNNLISLLRRERVRPILRLLDMDELDAYAARDNQPITHSESVQRLLTLLPVCIAKLSPMRQDIILTRLVETDHVADQVLASRWGTTTNTISSARHKARKHLSKLLTRAIH